MASQRLPSTSTLATAWCNQLNQMLFRTSEKLYVTARHCSKRKPEPESNGDKFDIFIKDLNDDVSSALAELQQLEERRTDTLSFEELLVHCDALYKANEDGIRKLELQLQQYGYSPVEAPKSIGEVVEDPSHKEIETDSQNPVEAISPPRSGATASSTDDYEASVVTPMVFSHEIGTVKKTLSTALHLATWETLEIWKALVFRQPVALRWLVKRNLGRGLALFTHLNIN